MRTDVVIVNKVKVGAAVIEGARRLRLVAVAATGTDNVDLQPCASRGITVSNIRKVTDDARRAPNRPPLIAMMRMSSGAITPCSM